MLASPSKDRRRKTSQNESLSSKKEQQPTRLIHQQSLEVSSPSTSDYKKGSSYAEIMKMKSKNIHKSVSPHAKNNPTDNIKKNEQTEKIDFNKEQVIQQEVSNFVQQKTKLRSSQDAASKIWSIFNQDTLRTNNSRKNSDKFDINSRDRDSFASASAFVSYFATVDCTDIPQPRQPLSPFLRSVLNELPLKNSQSTSSEGTSSVNSIQFPEAQHKQIFLPSPEKVNNVKESFSNDYPLKHYKNSSKPSMECDSSSISQSPTNPSQQYPQQHSKKVHFGFSFKNDEQTRLDTILTPITKQTNQAFKRSMEELFKLKDKTTISTEKLEYEELIGLMRMEQQIISNDIYYLTQQCNKYTQLIETKNSQKNSKVQHTTKLDFETLNCQQKNLMTPQESISCTSTTSFKKMISFLESTNHPTKTLIDLQSLSDQEMEEIIPNIKDKDGLIKTQRNAIARLFSSLKLRNTLLQESN